MHACELAGYPRSCLGTPHSPWLLKAGPAHARELAGYPRRCRGCAMHYAVPCRSPLSHAGHSAPHYDDIVAASKLIGSGGTILHSVSLPIPRAHLLHTCSACIAPIQYNTWGMQHSPQQPTAEKQAVMRL